MDPAEIEFVSESSLVQIVPRFRGPRLFLIGGCVGPFEPGVPVFVPLWVCCWLRGRRLCQVGAPRWLGTEALQEALDNEKATRLFTPPLSPHYLLEGKLLLEMAPEEIPHPDKVRTLLKDVWDIRMAKLRTSMDALVKATGAGNYARLDHLTLMEVNAAKPLLPLAMDQLHRLQKNAHTAVQNSVTNLSSSYMNTSSFSTQ